ncbi:MFS transporter [Actinacidiphila soli]|uniref:hypothetical protein n=1 Tax=Actinacidiphila soli TaxID=2487275 RepID=UPI0019D12FCF|nr:hypothetical protein [Actinacidiphila soli]
MVAQHDEERLIAEPAQADADADLTDPGFVGLFTINGAAIAFLAVPFILAGIGIGAVETAQHSAVAALAPKDLRGFAFGMLATVQSLGHLSAGGGIAGILWTAVSPTAAFTYLTVWMGIALIGLLISVRRRSN